MQIRDYTLLKLFTAYVRVSEIMRGDEFLILLVDGKFPRLLSEPGWGNCGKHTVITVVQSGSKKSHSTPPHSSHVSVRAWQVFDTSGVRFRQINLLRGSWSAFVFELFSIRMQARHNAGNTKDILPSYLTYMIFQSSFALSFYIWKEPVNGAVSSLRHW